MFLLSWLDSLLLFFGCRYGYCVRDSFYWVLSSERRFWWVLFPWLGREIRLFDGSL